MRQPNQRSDWERIRDSTWGNSYVNELYWLARDNVELCETIFERAPNPEVNGHNYIQVDHGVHRDLYRVLNNSARIAALIKDRPRRAGQGAGQYQIQQGRTQWLRELVAGLGVSELLHSRVRHSLEHFDELLDQTALKSLRQGIPAPTIFPLDMTLGTSDVMDRYNINGEHPAVYPLRVYIGAERVFVNCDRRIDIGAVATESKAIVDRTQESIPGREDAYPANSEDRGTPLLVISREAYGPGA